MNVNFILVLCAAAIGIAQILDSGLLIKKSSAVTTTAFSIAEWAWGAQCVYLLIKQADNFPVWLSGGFIAYLMGWLAYLAIQARRGRSADRFELTRGEAQVGAVFGALYAASAIASLARFSADS